VALVEVLRQPVGAAVGASGGPVHDADHEAAGVAGDGECQEEHGPRDAAHVLRELFVVEVDLSDDAEGLGQAGQHLLRHEQEAGGGVADPAAVALDGGGDEHGDDGEDDPRADPLQLGDAALAPGEALHGRHEHAVVEGEPEGERQHVEDDEGARGDVEAPAADAAVGLHGLEHVVVAEVGEHDVVDDAGGPDGEQARQALDLLHLLQRAEAPGVGGGAVLRGAHGRLVEAQELVGVRDLGDEAAPVRRVVEVGAGRGQASLARGGDEHLREAGEGAALGRDADVEARAHEEERTGEAHERGRHGQPQRPADVALEVDDDGGGDHHGDGEGEVVPVEEAVDAPAAGWGARVELVGAEGQVAGPDAAGADGQQREGGEEHGHLEGRGAAGGAAVGGRVERRHGGGEGEDDHAEEGGHGGEGDGGVAAHVGVAEEGAQERRQVDGARPEAEQGGGAGARHAVHGGEVHQQVGRGADGAQLLARLVPCSARRHRHACMHMKKP
jgi:hypothetical protein